MPYFIWVWQIFNPSLNFDLRPINSVKGNQINIDVCTDSSSRSFDPPPNVNLPLGCPVSCGIEYLGGLLLKASHPPTVATQQRLT